MKTSMGDVISISNAKTGETYTLKNEYDGEKYAIKLTEEDISAVKEMMNAGKPTVK